MRAARPGRCRKWFGMRWTNGETLWCRRSWIGREGLSSGEHLLNRLPGEFRGVGVHAHQIQNGGNKTEAVVRLLYLAMAGNAGVGAAREQKNAVHGSVQERAVIATRIEIAYVEVPRIVGEDEEVGLGQAVPALTE